MSADPFRRLDSSAPRSLQAAPALPPSSAAANVLTPFALPRSVNTTLPEAAAPRGRTTATASRPFLTPPATVTPAGADFTFTPLAPGHGDGHLAFGRDRHGECLGRLRGGTGYQEHGQSQE